MAGLTLKIVQKTDAKENGLRLLMIRAYVPNPKRLSRYAGTGISISKKDFNPKGSIEKANWVRPSHDFAETYNQSLKAKLKNILQKVADAETKGVEITLDLVQRYMKGEDATNFIQYYREYIERHNTEDQGRLYEKYQNTLTKLLMFTNGREISFSELTVPFIEKFEKWLLTDYRPLGKDGKPKPNGQPNKRNTASKTLSFIKTVVRSAIKPGHIAYAANPFLDYKLKTQKTTKTSLRKNEIDQFAEILIPEHLRAFHSRNIFLMQYYCVGTRIGDMLVMRWQNLALEFEGDLIVAGRIFFSMEKTDSPRNYVLPKKAIEILNYYYPASTKTGFIFPFLKNDIAYTVRSLQKAIESKTATINTDLITWTKKAGIEKHVTSHVARHSFAGEAIRNDVSIFDLRDLLGHSSVKDTQIYAKSVDVENLDKFIGKVFD